MYSNCQVLPCILCQIAGDGSSTTGLNQETLESASSITQALHGELAKQQKSATSAAAGANSKPLPTQLIKEPLPGLHVKVEQAYDPTKELSKLISELKCEEAFVVALQRNDVPGDQ